MKCTIKIGAWRFEPKLWQARREGEEGSYGDDYDGVSNIHQLEGTATFEALLLKDSEFTRDDFRDFKAFCKLKGLEYSFKRARDIA